MWMSKGLCPILGVALLSVAASCDRSGRDLIPLPSDEHPAVIEVGEVPVVSPEELLGFTTNGCDLEAPETGCVWASVGASISSGVRSGATFTFSGTGGSVCLVVDSEAVSWGTVATPSLTVEDSAWEYIYPDNITDDGDADLTAGLTSYYTGSPGVELGDFAGFYTDSLGSTVSIDYEACTQVGSRGQTNAHGGRGAVEYCDVDTPGREGVGYTVVIESFTVALDDAVLSFKAAVVDGPCSGVDVDGDDNGVIDVDRNGDVVGSTPNECTLSGEALDLATGATRDGYLSFERDFCVDSAANFRLIVGCCEHPEFCGEEPVGVCDDTLSYCCDAYDSSDGGACLLSASEHDEYCG